MKKILIFLFFAALVNAQTNRFIYEMKFKPDSTKTEYRIDNMVLDINPEEVKFYPYAVIEMDSLSKTGHPRTGFETQLPYIIRQKTGNKNTSYFLNDALFQIETTDEINWKLLPETKSVDSYLLQKATTRFGGRNWTAWFSKDVNISEGPYKFKGLPGLIFSIADDKDNYSFRLVKNKSYPKTYDTSSYFEKFAGKKAIPYTEAQYRKKLLEVYRDPWFDLKQQMKSNEGQSFYIYGTVVKTMDGFREVTLNEQARIRRENNPIEISKVIHYPIK
ncbi:GLPGLI family protein [Chryseobacterium taklimakanense]|uniref:GLPGLI family protein n=1 Tax=Chryseobacterium taklimakanense TaxID=536441 RepID=UPI0023F664A7|nr:GLPGLI family protein [Chryseobacterium taklimakanense]